MQRVEPPVNLVLVVLDRDSFDLLMDAALSQESSGQKVTRLLKSLGKIILQPSNMFGKEVVPLSTISATPGVVAYLEGLEDSDPTFHLRRIGDSLVFAIAEHTSFTKVQVKRVGSDSSTLCKYARTPGVAEIVDNCTTSLPNIFDG